MNTELDSRFIQLHKDWRKALNQTKSLQISEGYTWLAENKSKYKHFRRILIKEIGFRQFKKWLRSQVN